MGSRSLGFVSLRCFSIAGSTSCGIGVRASKRSGTMDCRGRRLLPVRSFTQLLGGCLVATGFFAWPGALLLAGFVAYRKTRVGEYVAAGISAGLIERGF